EVWMGTTMGCAQCHNHKYDPFTQKEYYQLFAFFNSTADHGTTNDPDIALPADQATTAREGRVRARLPALQAGLLTPNPFLAVALAKAGENAAAGLDKERKELQPTTLVLQELPRPRSTHVLIRGNHNTKGEEVRPGVPAIWHPLPKGQPTNRLALACWLVDT